jgi:hypothetical protein
VRRIFLVALLAACAPSPPAPPPDPPRLEALAVEGIVVDGFLDEVWGRAGELVVPLNGGGPGEVTLKAAHDGKRLYLLAIWPDAKLSRSRYWRYEGDLKWAKSESEDAFSVCWSPGALAAEFRARACAVACHGDRHVLPGAGSRIVDFWYWGAQQCALFPEARDMCLKEGDAQRLRGDAQPEGSDNMPNVSNKYDGPCAFPRFRRDGDDRIIPWGKNLQEVTPDWIRRYWNEETNIGREVPLEFLRGRKGSRGDVLAAAKYQESPHGSKWVLEMARDFATGNPDDLPLGTGAVLFAIAVHDDAHGAAHAVSGPIELSFLPAP